MPVHVKWLIFIFLTKSCIVLRCVDWLVTTFNEDLPDESQRMPDPHPSAISATLVDNHDSDYHRLVNTVERHTRCSAAYCLKQKTGNPLAECRFGFPKPQQEETAMVCQIKGKNNKTVESTLITKRNDERLNSHNRVMLENWRANVDLQVIVDEKACAKYMTKYDAKGEPRSKSASKILKLSVTSLQNHDRVSSAVKKTMIQVAGDRDMAAQETAHMLLSLPLVACTYSFIAVSLQNSRRLNLDAENDGGDVLQKSVLQEYGERTTSTQSRYTGLSKLNLMQYTSQYTKYRGQLIKRANPCIVRTFPKVLPNPKGPRFGEYCKYQLIKFKPWESQPSNVWDNEEESNEMFVNMYDVFLSSENGKEYVFRHSVEKDLVETTKSNRPDDNNDDGESDPRESEDEAVV